MKKTSKIEIEPADRGTFILKYFVSSSLKTKIACGSREMLEEEAKTLITRLINSVEKDEEKKVE